MIPVRQCVPRVLKAVLVEQPLSPGKVRLAWRCAVGDALDRATAVRLRPDGVLEVSVRERAWRAELERSRALIRARLQEILGTATVRALAFVTGSPRSAAPARHDA